MASNGRLDRALAAIERVGNALPDPVVIFAGLAALVFGLSGVGAALGWGAVHPKDGAVIGVVSLMTAEGLRGVLVDAVKEFVTFPPLGVVLVTMLGVGLCERVGLVGAALQTFVARVPGALLPPAVVFAGVQSSLAADAGYVVLIPVGAAAFAAAGRHPVAGITAAFAGVSGGFSANLLVTSLDPLLGGITEAAARLVQPDAVVPATANYLFMVASTVVVTLLGTLVTVRVIEPRLGPAPAGEGEVLPATGDGKGLWAAAGAAGAVVAFTLALTLPTDGVLREAGVTGVASFKPFFDALIPLLALMFGAAGLTYGWVTGSVRNTRELGEHLAVTMASMGSYLALAFVMAQFLSWFKKSNLGVVAAIHGAELLRSSGMGGVPLLLALVYVTAVINLLMASASAKWAILAPIFVPMLALVGIEPGATQAAYRVGDSSTNMVTPLLPYVPLVLAQVRRYDPTAGLGSLLALMVPYSVSLLIGWTLFLGVWLALGIPLGLG